MALAASVVTFGGKAGVNVFSFVALPGGHVLGTTDWLISLCNIIPHALCHCWQGWRTISFEDYHFVGLRRLGGKREENI